MQEGDAMWYMRNRDGWLSKSVIGFDIYIDVCDNDLKRYEQRGCSESIVSLLSH